ncbi:MAG: hypothetical protein ACRD2C_27105, partial [Acidimicrobiales bacterium]
SGVAVLIVAVEQHATLAIPRASPSSDTDPYRRPYRDGGPVSGKAVLVVVGTLAVAMTAFVVITVRGFQRTTGTAPTREDRRRTDIMAEDPMLDLDLSILQADGPVTTTPGGGEGPWARAGEVRRHYTSDEPPDRLVGPISEAAETTGWSMVASRPVGEGGTRRFIRGSRADQGFGQSLAIYIGPTESGSSIRVIITTDSASISSTSRLSGGSGVS